MECFHTLCLERLDASDDFAVVAVAVLMEIVVFAYCFVALSIVCEHHLLLSLETLCVRWRVREDVAGATFMALGSAAPEIIINAIGAIQGEPDLGVGAIIGSGMIGFSVIPGLCALVATDTLTLKRRPLFRDVIIYTVALTMLTVAMQNAVIELWEAVAFLAVYAAYVGAVFLSPNIRFCWRRRKLQREYQERLDVATANGASRDELNRITADFESALERKSFVEERAEQSALKASHRQYNGAESADDIRLSELNGASSDGDAPLHNAQSQCASVMRILTAPMRTLFQLTCPPCKHDESTAYLYPLTFLLSFLWVAVISFIINAIANRWNDLTGLPLALLGIVLVAVGAEVPDGVQSVAVARKGYGAMAISNAFGAQIANILFGLGLPWSLANVAAAVDDSAPIICITEHEELTIAALYQFGNIMMFLLILMPFTSRIDKPLLARTKAYFFMAAYVVAVAGFCLTSSLVRPNNDDSKCDNDER